MDFRERQMEFARVVLEHAEQKGLKNIPQIAEYVGLHVQTFRRVLRGITPSVPFDTIYLICRGLDINLYWVADVLDLDAEVEGISEGGKQPPQ